MCLVQYVQNVLLKHGVQQYGHHLKVILTGGSIKAETTAVFGAKDETNSVNRITWAVNPLLCNTCCNKNTMQLSTSDRVVSDLTTYN